MIASLVLGRKKCNSIELPILETGSAFCTMKTEKLGLWESLYTLPSNLTFFFHVNVMPQSPTVRGMFHTYLVSPVMGQIDTRMWPGVSDKGLRAGRKEKEEQKPPEASGGIFKEILLKGC